VRAWEAEILAFHVTNGCSDGPTEAVNLLIKKVQRVGHGFRNFATIGCGFTAASDRRLTQPQDCEAAPPARWRRATNTSTEQRPVVDPGASPSAP
jgi:hypothetical protein